MKDIQLPYDLVEKITSFIMSTRKFEYNRDYGFSQFDDIYNGQMNINHIPYIVTKIRFRRPVFAEAKEIIERKFPNVTLYKPEEFVGEYGLLLNDTPARCNL